MLVLGRWSMLMLVLRHWLNAIFALPHLLLMLAASPSLFVALSSTVEPSRCSQTGITGATGSSAIATAMNLLLLGELLVLHARLPS